MPGEGRWLLVSKPLRAPFLDGSTVLVRTLVQALPAACPLAYLGDPRAPLRPDADDVVIGHAPLGHAPSFLEKASVMRELLRPRFRSWPVHFFFAPNAITSAALSSLRRWSPRRPIVQSVTSSHGAARHAGRLRLLDAVVALSDATASTLIDAGVDAERVHRIHPAVAPVEPEVGTPPRRMLYAGDLDAAVARRLVAVGRWLDRPELEGWTLVIACRPKGEDDAAARASIRRKLPALLAAGRVELRGEIEDMDGLLRSCGLQLFLADHVRRKVDLPLVLLEGLARGLGLLTLSFSPVSEILDRGKEHGLEIGMGVDPASGDDALAAALVAACGRAKLSAWRAAAPELVRREFSPQRLAADHRTLYERLGGCT